MADRAEALRARLIATFKLEAAEHLQTIGAELDAIAADPSANAARLETVFRAMHTLKGAARSVGIADVEGAAHRCEALLSAAVQSGAPPDAALVRTLFDANDAFAAYLAGTLAPGALDRAGVVVESAEPPPAAPPPAPAAPPATAADAIRVDTGRLDRLMVLAENLLAPKLAVTEYTARAAALAESIRRLHARHGAIEELRSIEAEARALATALRADQRTLPAIVDDMYDELLRIRLTTAATLFEGFPMMVRDLCRITGKEVVWQSGGEHLEIDRKVLALVKDPIVHMIRNAIDHGIEPPDVREAAGKPRRGTVSVTVTPAERGRVCIEVADDGKGFALDALREAAVRSRATSADDVASMSDEDLTELAFSAGVSTSPVVTTISGHGRGLAIVREAIEKIEGSVTTRSTPGAGTVIRLELPASIVTYRALLVGAAGERYLIPLDAVERTVPLARETIARAHETRETEIGERRLPFAHLGDVLGLAPQPPSGDERRELPCVVIRSGERRGALLVDEVFGVNEIVVKELRPPLRRIRCVLAAGLLGTGSLVLVLRPLDILLALRAARREPPAAAPAAKRVTRLLVVDDSMTTRTMERTLFESAGYAVTVAADGLEAWALLQTEPVDVVVSDVDMPRLDGFGLTARIRAHPALATLPVVLVTARETREGEEHGLRAGADAYVLKSSFDQSALLETVRRFA